MIDIGKLSYRLVVMDEVGNQYDLKDLATQIGWEENEKELSARLTFRCCNKLPTGYLSDTVKIGCLAVVMASDGVKEEEVVRGYIKEWEPSMTATEDSFSVTAYDDLYTLQKSQDSYYLQAGLSTQAAISKILSPWSVSFSYTGGAEAVHGKLKYANKSLADCILDILSDAVDKGEKECIMRAEKGAVQVLPKGSNPNIYVFDGDSGVKLSHKRSISNMVTRVKVLGRETKSGRYPVEAVVDGKVEFGIIQKVITKEKSQTIAEAKAAAQKILNDEGTVEEKVTLQLPDVPFVRKGDYIYVNNLCGVDGYLEVLSIQHDADTASMTITGKVPKEVN